eukprot:COSAG02_NODE_1867_length_10594_cov_221.941591_8_plen_263_part_00
MNSHPRCLRPAKILPQGRSFRTIPTGARWSRILKSVRQVPALPLLTCSRPHPLVRESESEQDLMDSRVRACPCTPADASLAIITGVVFVATAILPLASVWLDDPAFKERHHTIYVVASVLCYILAFLIGSTIVYVGVESFASGLSFLGSLSDLSEPCGDTADYDQLSELRPLVLMSTTITAAAWLLIVCLALVAIGSGIEWLINDSHPSRQADAQLVQQLEQQVQQLQQQVRQLQPQPQPQPQATQPNPMLRGADEAYLAKP